MVEAGSCLTLELNMNFGVSSGFELLFVVDPNPNVNPELEVGASDGLSPKDNAGVKLEDSTGLPKLVGCDEENELANGKLVVEPK